METSRVARLYHERVAVNSFFMVLYTCSFIIVDRCWFEAWDRPQRERGAACEQPGEGAEDPLYGVQKAES